MDGHEKWTPPGHKGADKRDLVFDSALEFILPGSIANDRQLMVILEVSCEHETGLTASLSLHSESPSKL